MTVTLIDFINEFSKNYSVQHFDDICAGIFIAKVKEDIYLIENAEVNEV